MQLCLIYDDASGFCKIIVPKGDKWASLDSDEAAVRNLHAVAIPDCVEFIACRLELIPTDRTFRQAWRKGTAKEPIVIDFADALAIHRKRLEEACALKVEQLQRDLVLALEKDNLPEVVAIRRTSSIMRNLSVKTDLTHCKTVDDIKWSIPRELFDVWHWYPPRQ